LKVGKEKEFEMFKKLAGLFAALTVGLCFAGSAMAGTIVGSAHDFNDGTGFTADGWNTTGEICVVCHTPHTQESTDGPLWNRAAYVAGTFTMYDDTDLDGVADAGPSGTSLLCLSCHDGTVALDSFGGATGSTPVTGDPLLDTDLSDDHPVSITYVAGTGAGQDPELQATDFGVTFGNAATGTVADLLESSRVQCSSCHDVHNTESVAGEPNLLRIDNTGGVSGSELCLSCHDK